MTGDRQNYDEQRRSRVRQARERRTETTAREPRRRSQRNDRRRKENVAAMAVIAAMLVCLAVVALAIWNMGNPVGPNAVQADGEPVPPEVNGAGIRAAAAQGEEGTSGGTGAGQGFQQLSDPFLVLVNNEVPLPDGWQVTPNFIGEETVDMRIYNDLNNMFLAAQEDGITLWVASGYRSVEDQERILDREIKAHMRDDGMTEEEAREYSLRTINPPGYSEHHTGFVVDLNDVSDDFEETEAYRWLCEHAAEYGFVQRYRSDKVEYTGIDNESWHYRYVGPENAQQMQQLDMCLEEYVQYLKDRGIR
ncbi:M15 family metallopeptidase [Acutalibacter caecimuris]|uniref:M15 family metallopeptidase n=1 Tax=Acutalibacter caecimuris TaxID=3093657 RepID=UPI002AC8BFB9|nr:M15 family metallopeptidase [Acutalibacter sp. M00118]